MALPGFMQVGTERDGQTDLASRPERPDFTMSPDSKEMLEFFNNAAQSVKSQQFVEDNDYATELLRNMVLSRRMEALNPTPMKPQLGELDPNQVIAARKYESDRLNAIEDKITEAQKMRYTMRNFAEDHPDLANSLNINDDWFDSLTKGTASAAKKGWRALDILIRNLDRGRAAITSYELAVQQGSSNADAMRRGKAALMGSDKGWRWVPEKQAPSWKEVLLAAGMDDELTTSAMGLGLDILVDPINILGVGASRKGIEIAAHQILNKHGRQMYGQFIRRNLDEMVQGRGVASELDLPIELQQAAHAKSAANMRDLINQGGKDKAYQLLDIGGLKIAGFTLPGTAHVTRREVLRGGVEFDYVSESLARMFGRGTLKGLDKIGSALQADSHTDIVKKVGKFASLIPENIRGAGRLVGLTFSRTSPAAGKEYGWFKQAEYYDRLGMEELHIKERVKRMFEGIHNEDLNALPLHMEKGAAEQYIQQVGAVKGMQYGQRLGQSMAEYRAAMDELILDEVQRGFIKREWQTKPELLEAFEQWTKSGGQMQLDPEMLKKFNKVRITNYIPHIYHNAAKARKLAPPASMPSAPSITEPFTRPRVVPTLEEAVARGLVPETNLAAIAVTRMTSHVRARTTHEFLEKAVEQFGATRSGVAGASYTAALSAGKIKPEPLWKELMQARTDMYGKVALGVSEQLDLARRLTLASNVPIKAIAKLDDVAIKEFLQHRLRVVTAGKSGRVWRKYVEVPSEKGIYDGYALAPARTEAAAVAAARDLVDPAYPTWGFVKAGGVADPDKLGDMLFPLPIVEDLERLKVRPPEEFRRMMRMYDTLNYWWKRNVTILWPAFHVRNKVTNLVNSAMDIGLTGIADRGAMYGMMRGADGVLSLPGNTRMSYSQVRKLARRHGVIHASYRRADVSQMIQDMVRTDTKGAARIARRLGVKLPGRAKLAAKGELLGPEQISMPLLAPHKAGEEVGMLIENSDRMQLFVKSLQRGMSPEQAARRVKSFLFDYEDISRFEQNIIRRFFNPFWTWTRKNLALQAKLAVRTPGRFVAPAKFARGLSAESDDAMRSDVERELLPRYLGDMFGVRLEAGAALSKWMLNIDMPAEDLNRLWQGDMQGTMREWLSSVGPFARDLLETAVGQDFYSGKSRVELVRGTRVYDVVAKLDGTKMGKWLELQKKPYREQVNYYVNGAKWRKLNWLTAWQLTRAYTSVGKISDPAQGTFTQRLFNFLTGMKVDYLRPQEEIRRMADSAVLTRDTSALNAMRTKWDDAMKLLILQGGAQNEGDELLLRTHEAVRTPIYGAELDTKDTWEYDEAEEGR